MAKTVLVDGFSTLISFAADIDVEFTVKSITPPAFEGGGEIDTTTMENAAYRTAEPKSLIGIGDAKATVAYDPVVLESCKTLVNNKNAITITFPDATTLVFWGWLDSFTPGEHAEGEQPTAEIVIKASNTDALTAEIAPVHA